jgi:enamine deaminase RidA (YjgF/YER057c/UK114 family)
MSFTAIEPEDFPWFDYSRYTFSLGLRHGAHAYLSGHSASEYDREQGRIVVRGGMAEQTRTAYAKIERILEAAGLGFGDVVRLVENVTIAGIDHYAEAEQVRGEVFGGHTPVVTTVCVESLLRPAAWIEIEVVAGPSEQPLRFDAEGRVAWAPVREVADIVYIASCLPLGEAGQLVGEGDLVAQTEQVFRVAERRLAALGLDASNIAKTVDYTTPATLGEYKRTGAVRREHLSAPYPAATGILMPRIAGPSGTLTQLDVLASRHPLEVVNPGWERYGKLTYSPAVRGGDVLFMSGQAALDPVTEQAVHAGDVAAQAAYTYDNLVAVLEAAGAGPEHLVKTVEYVTPAGLPGYRAVAGVRERVLRDPWPASTGIVCGGLLRPEFEIEVDSLALLDDTAVAPERSSGGAS